MRVAGSMVARQGAWDIAGSHTQGECTLHVYVVYVEYVAAVPTSPCFSVMGRALMCWERQAYNRILHLPLPTGSE